MKEIEQQLKQLTDALGLPEVSREALDVERAACEEVLAKAKALIRDMPIMLDYLYHPRPLGLAKLLLTHGFNVKAVYLDGISPEEKAAFDWLQEHATGTGTDRNNSGKNAACCQEAVKRKCLPSGRKPHISAAAVILSIWCRGKACMDWMVSAELRN